jgi:hypothetical protein
MNGIFLVVYAVYAFGVEAGNSCSVNSSAGYDSLVTCSRGGSCNGVYDGNSDSMVDVASEYKNIFIVGFVGSILSIIGGVLNLTKF